MLLQNALLPCTGQPPMNIINLLVGGLGGCLHSATNLFGEAHSGSILLGAKGKPRLRVKEWITMAIGFAYC